MKSWSCDSSHDVGLERDQHNGLTFGSSRPPPRISYASLVLATGLNAAIVSRRLGHATVAFTLDIYSNVLPQVDAEAAELIAAFTGGEN